LAISKEYRKRGGRHGKREEPPLRSTNEQKRRIP